MYKIRVKILAYIHLMSLKLYIAYWLYSHIDDLPVDTVYSRSSTVIAVNLECGKVQSRYYQSVYTVLQRWVYDRNCVKLCDKVQQSAMDSL